jgi:hypothetical protein
LKAEVFEARKRFENFKYPLKVQSMITFILPESPVCSISFTVEDVAGLYAGKLKPGP